MGGIRQPQSAHVQRHFFHDGHITTHLLAVEHSTWAGGLFLRDPPPPSFLLQLLPVRAASSPGRCPVRTLGGGWGAFPSCAFQSHSPALPGSRCLPRSPARPILSLEMVMCPQKDPQGARQAPPAPQHWLLPLRPAVGAGMCALRRQHWGALRATLSLLLRSASPSQRPCRQGVACPVQGPAPSPHPPNPAGARRRRLLLGGACVGSP